MSPCKVVTSLRAKQRKQHSVRLDDVWKDVIACGLYYVFFFGMNFLINTKEKNRKGRGVQSIYVYVSVQFRVGVNVAMSATQNR